MTATLSENSSMAPQQAPPASTRGRPSQRLRPVRKSTFFDRVIHWSFLNPHKRPRNIQSWLGQASNQSSRNSSLSPTRDGLLSRARDALGLQKDADPVDGDHRLPYLEWYLDSCRNADDPTKSTSHASKSPKTPLASPKPNRGLDGYSTELALELFRFSYQLPPPQYSPSSPHPATTATKRCDAIERPPPPSTDYVLDIPVAPLVYYESGPTVELVGRPGQSAGVPFAFTVCFNIGAARILSLPSATSALEQHHDGHHHGPLGRQPVHPFSESKANIGTFEFEVRIIQRIKAATKAEELDLHHLLSDPRKNSLRGNTEATNSQDKPSDVSSNPSAITQSKVLYSSRRRFWDISTPISPDQPETDGFQSSFGDIHGAIEHPFTFYFPGDSPASTCHPYCIVDYTIEIDAWVTSDHVPLGKPLLKAGREVPIAHWSTPLTVRRPLLPSVAHQSRRDHNWRLSVRDVAKTPISICTNRPLVVFAAPKKSQKSPLYHSTNKKSKDFGRYDFPIEISIANLDIGPEERIKGVSIPIMPKPKKSFHKSSKDAKSPNGITTTVIPYRRWAVSNGSWKLRQTTVLAKSEDAGDENEDPVTHSEIIDSGALMGDWTVQETRRYEPDYQQDTNLADSFRSDGSVGSINHSQISVNASATSRPRQPVQRYGDGAQSQQSSRGRSRAPSQLPSRNPSGTRTATGSTAIADGQHDLLDYPSDTEDQLESARSSVDHEAPEHDISSYSPIIVDTRVKSKIPLLLFQKLPSEMKESKWGFRFKKHSRGGSLAGMYRGVPDLAVPSVGLKIRHQLELAIVLTEEIVLRIHKDWGGQREKSEGAEQKSPTSSAAESTPPSSGPEKSSLKSKRVSEKATTNGLRTSIDSSHVVRRTGALLTLRYSVPIEISDSPPVPLSLNPNYETEIEYDLSTDAPVSNNDWLRAQLDNETVEWIERAAPSYLGLANSEPSPAYAAQ